MIKLLSALFSKSPAAPPAPRIKAETDGIIVSIQSYRVPGGSSDEARLESGLSQVVEKLAGLCQLQSGEQGQLPVGTVVYTFRIEPDGKIRMVLEGDKALVSGDITGINEQFIGAVMSRQVQFPPLGQSTTVETKIRLEKR